jgi:hypothetical protein
MSVVRYRKRPVEVDAIHFDGSHQSVLAVMCFVDAGRGTTELDIYADSDPAKSHITLQTLEGKMRANAGDWIVRGVRGEFHPVRGDIFAETYEPVEEATAEAATATPNPLTDAERAFLTFALDLAADRMLDRSDEFTTEDDAALKAFRCMAGGGDRRG